MVWTVAEVPVTETYPLRRGLLRGDRPDLDLHLPDDDIPGAFHLAARDDAGAIVGVASVMPGAPEFAAPLPSWRLRQMAVAADAQGSGAGTALFEAVLTRLRVRDAASLWAESRDSSLGFYLARGMRVVPGRRHTVGTVAYTDVVLALPAVGLKGEKVIRV